MTGPEQPQVIPEWVATLVGRLVLENEAMRQALAAQPPPAPLDDTGTSP